MRQTIQDLISTMADRHERKEFIGSFACVIVMMAVMFLLMVMFQSDGLF